MKIHSLAVDDGFTQTCRADLSLIANLPTAKEQRVCKDCTQACPCSTSATCSCQCSAHCLHINQELSSEPQAFPLESKIIPLVYALSSLRISRPCWSCEGHEQADGRLRKTPSVWFYTESPHLNRLIVEYLSTLYGYKHLNYPWSIEILGIGDEMQTTYALRPNLAWDSQPKLAELHDDIETISKLLFQGVKDLARQHLNMMKIQAVS